MAAPADGKARGPGGAAALLSSPAGPGLVPSLSLPLSVAGTDLEASLLSFEKLDRASPDLWPEQRKFGGPAAVCQRGAGGARPARPGPAFPRAAAGAGPHRAQKGRSGGAAAAGAHPPPPFLVSSQCPGLPSSPPPSKA